MIEIVADVHERDSGIAQGLRSLGWSVQETTLEASDYVIGATVGVERKTVTDFATSLKNGRLFQQLAGLQQTVQKPLLIIEGNQDELGRLHPNSVKGVVVSLCVKWSIPVLWSQNSQETASLIHMIAKQNSRIRTRWQPTLAEKPTTKRELQLQLLTRIPQVGLCSAEAILKHFGSLEHLLSASESDLQQAKGIGRKRASTIHHTLHESVVEYQVR